MLYRLDVDLSKTIVVMVSHDSFDESSIRAVKSNASFARDMGFQAIVCVNEFEELIVEQALEETLFSGREDILTMLMLMSLSQHSSVEIPKKYRLPKEERGHDEIVGGRTIRIMFVNEVGLDPV